MLCHFLHPLFGLLASATRQDLARQVAYLKAENKILRTRLPQRITPTEKERRTLLRAGRKLGIQLKALISIVTYGTFLRWIRETEKSHTQKTVSHRKPGRPRTPDEIRDLIIQIRKETGYGYTRILGQLRKLGIHISRQTVKSILREAGLEGEPPEGRETWDSFLKRHADTLWQCDFVTKPIWTTRGLVDLYVLVFLHLGTRRCWISPSTRSPDSAWVTQQGRNFLLHAEDVELVPTIVMRDNDTKYTAAYDEVLASAGAVIKRNTPASPNLRAHVERFIQTLQVECLDKFVVVAEKHLNLICREFTIWYNRERGHSARDHLPPAWENVPVRVERLKRSEVVCTTRLGGLLKSYARRAA